MTGAPVPDSLLDGIALVEAISADDIEGVACLLRHARLTECAAVLDSLLARELVFSPLYEACAILRDLGTELRADPSPGGTVVSLARQLCCRWCDPCVQDGSFRAWALGQHHGH